MSIPAVSSNDGQQQLESLFSRAERCYLMDDYQQLDSCIVQYIDVFNKYQDILGDSIDIYRAYFGKMCGAYYYGFAEDDSCAYYAETYYRESLGIFNSKVATTTIRGMHANAVTLHQELAQLYYKTKDYIKAKAQLDTVYTYYHEKLLDGIDDVSSTYYKAETQLAMTNARLGYFDLALRQIDEAINDYFKPNKDADYYEALRKRGKILMLQADSLGLTDYKKAVDCYRQYVGERCSAVAKEMREMDDSQRGQYWLAIHQFLYDCYRLGNRAPEMLYDLALFSKDYLVRKDATQTKWQEVRRALGKKDCAIEFVQYYGKHDERRLGCLVLKSNSQKPLFIDLLSTDSLLDLPLTALHTIGSAITYPVTSVKDTLYNDPRLPQMIWTQQLLSAIGDADKIYFSPDGLIHQLAIEYLMPYDNKICYRLSSTRNLTKKRTGLKMASALLCGGVEYSANILPEEKGNDVLAYRFLAPQTTTINNLPGTAKEVEYIYFTRVPKRDTLLVGAKATDEAVLQLLRHDYDIVHLATHGYFGGRIGIYNDLKPLLNDESMSKSGLLFAGSANTLTDKEFDENLYDGVLSATELSKQDLSNTELVVLSACQTGLGHLTEDGIYGIQRGLKMAGANTMILTLWSVNDYSGCLLMRFFYEELEKQSDKDIHAAFLKARQRLMREQTVIEKFDEATLTFRKETIRYNTPQHVNPYIIIDAY